MTSKTTSFAEELIESSRQAWREVSVAKEAAKRYDEALKNYLVGRKIRISGSAAPISGGTVHSDFARRKTLKSELVTVTAVFYYYNETYRNHEDSFRVRTSDGSEYELVLSTTKFEDVEESQDAS